MVLPASTNVDTSWLVGLAVRHVGNDQQFLKYRQSCYVVSLQRSSDAILDGDVATLATGARSNMRS